MVYGVLAIAGIVALVALWWVSTEGPLRRALREMGGQREQFVLGYLGGHPGLSVRSPLVMCVLFLTPQGLLIQVLGQYARIRFADLVEATEDEWQGPRWKGSELADARGEVEDRHVPVLRITFMGDRGFTDSALFVCQEVAAGVVARRVMQAAGDGEG